jgi:acylphosphatase
VRNLPDGRVEALVEAAAEVVEAFKHDLATGPEFSKVKKLEEIVIEPSGLYSSFRIER